MSGSTSGYAVAVEDHEQVRVLVLDRPQKLNAFTAEGYRALAAQLASTAEDPLVSVCVLTGRGRAFSAGVDLDEVEPPSRRRRAGCRVRRTPRAPGAVSEAARGCGQRPRGGVRGNRPPPLRPRGGRRDGHDPPALRGSRHVRRGRAAVGCCRVRVGPQRAAWMMLSGAPMNADEAVATGFALVPCPGRPSPGEGPGGRPAAGEPSRGRVGGEQATVARGLCRADRRGVAAREGGNDGPRREDGPHCVAGPDVAAPSHTCPGRRCLGTGFRGRARVPAGWPPRPGRRDPRLARCRRAS